MLLIFFFKALVIQDFFSIIFVIPHYFNLIIMNDKDFLTVKELAEWIRLSKSKIYSLVAENKIPHVKVGGKILFVKSAILTWIESQTI